MTHMNRYVSGRGSLHSKGGRSRDRPVKIRKSSAGEDEIRPEMADRRDHPNIQER